MAIRSPLGPDERLVVIDAASGRQRWQVDGAGSAVLAGHTVLLDRRASHSLRELVARDVDTGRERWVRPSSGWVAASYIGGSGEAAFVLTGPALARVDLATGRGGRRGDGAFDARTARPRWTERLPLPVQAIALSASGPVVTYGDFPAGPCM